MATLIQQEGEMLKKKDGRRKEFRKNAKLWKGTIKKKQNMKKGYGKQRSETNIM